MSSGKHWTTRTPDLTQDRCGSVSMEPGECGTPAQVAGSVHGIRMPGDGPALDMLTAHGEAQYFRSIGSELVKPDGHALGIQEFFRIDRSLKNFRRGICGVR